MLDPETRQAARQLALRCGCSMSEAIRRAVRGHRHTVFVVPAESRTERRKVLDRLFQLFEGNDAEEEISRLKAQDRGLLMRYRIDTDYLVFALPDAGPERRRLTQLAESDAELQMSAVAWYGFCRGPRTPEQISIAGSFFFDDGIIPFSEEIAGIAADVLRGLGSPRRRAADVAIGVTCAALEATLLTRSAGDFAGVPHLQVEEPGE